MINPLQKVWGYLQQASDYWDVKTQPIQAKSVADKIEALKAYYQYKPKQLTKFETVVQDANNKAFLNKTVDSINRSASHRTAFMANALFQILFVNVGTLSLLSFIPSIFFKIFLVAANLFLAYVAWRQLRHNRQALITGPSTEPRWTLWGMLRGNRRRHNKHVKSAAKPHKIRMRDERLFSIVYSINALCFFFAAQLIFSSYMPSFIGGLLNFPLFIITIPLTIANAYWAFKANNQVVKAATERGSTLDKLKL